MTFPWNGESCVASKELPMGYVLVSDATCQSLSVSPGIDPVPQCLILNTADDAIIFFNGFEQEALDDLQKVYLKPFKVPADV